MTRTAVAGTGRVVRDPVAVFEILGPGTAKTDRISEIREYRATPSIRRHAVLAQARVAATVFGRAGDDRIGHVLARDDAFRIPGTGAEPPLAALYDGSDGFGPADD